MPRIVSAHARCSSAAIGACSRTRSSIGIVALMNQSASLALSATNFVHVLNHGYVPLIIVAFNSEARNTAIAASLARAHVDPLVLGQKEKRRHGLRALGIIGRHCLAPVEERAVVERLHSVQGAAVPD